MFYLTREASADRVPRHAPLQAKTPDTSHNQPHPPTPSQTKSDNRTQMEREEKAPARQPPADLNHSPDKNENKPANHTSKAENSSPPDKEKRQQFQSNRHRSPNHPGNTPTTDDPPHAQT